MGAAPVISLLLRWPDRARSSLGLVLRCCLPALGELGHAAPGADSEARRHSVARGQAARPAIPLACMHPGGPRGPPCHWQWELNFTSRRRAGLTVGSLQARLRGLGLATGSGLQRPGVHTGQVSFATTAVGPKAPGRRQSESTAS